MADTSYIMNLVVRAENAINAIEKLKVLSEHIPQNIVVDLAMKSNNLDLASKDANKFGMSLGLAGDDLDRFVKQLLEVSKYLGSGKTILAGGQFNQLADTIKSSLSVLGDFRDRMLMLNNIKGLQSNLIPGFVDFNGVLSTVTDRVNAIFASLGKTATKPQVILEMIKLQQILTSITGQIPGMGAAIEQLIGAPITALLGPVDRVRTSVAGMATGFASTGKSVNPLANLLAGVGDRLERVDLGAKDLLAISRSIASEGLLGKNVSAEADKYASRIVDIRTQFTRLLNTVRGGLTTGILNPEEYNKLIPIIDLIRVHLAQLSTEEQVLNYLAKLNTNEFLNNQSAVAATVNALRAEGKILQDSAISSSIISRNRVAAGSTAVAGVVNSGAAADVTTLSNAEKELLQTQLNLLTSMSSFALSTDSTRGNIAGLLTEVSSAKKDFGDLGLYLIQVRDAMLGVTQIPIQQTTSNASSTFAELTQRVRDAVVQYVIYRDELAAVRAEISRQSVPYNGMEAAPDKALVAREKELLGLMSEVTAKYTEADAAQKQYSTNATQAYIRTIRGTAETQRLLASSIGVAESLGKAYAGISSDVDRAAASLKKYGVASGLAAARAGMLAPAMKKATESIAQMSQKGERMFEQTNSSIKDFSFFMNLAIEKIIRYRVAFYLMQKSIELFKNTFTFAKQVEAQMAELDRILIGSGANIKELKDAAYDLGRTFGVAFKDIVNVMTIWAQQGKTQNEIIALTKTTTIAMVTANLDAKTAVEALTAAQMIYNVAAEDSIIVFDKILNVERLYAVTTQDLAESIKLLGSTAEEFGMSMDELLGSVTAVGQVTRRSGSQVANSLKTIFANFTQDDTMIALRDMGVAINDTYGNIRPMGKVLDDLSARWSTLTEAQRINIAKLVGGVRHYASFIVLMDQYAVKLEATANSANSSGFAHDALDKKINTLQQNVQKLTVFFQQLVEATGKSTFGFANTIGGLLKIFNSGDTSGLSAFQKGISELSGFLLTFAVNLVAVKGFILLYQLAVSKASEAISMSVLANAKVVSTSMKGLNTEVDLASRGMTMKGIIGMTNATKAQQIALADMLRKAKVGTVVMAQMGTELVYVEKCASGAAAQIYNVGTASEVAAGKMGLLARASGVAKGAVFGFGTIFKGLYAAMGGWVGIAALIIVSILPSLINKFKKAKDNLGDFTESVQNNAVSLIDAAEAQKKYLNNIVTLGAEFKVFADQFNALEGKPEEQTKAFGAMISVFDQIRGRRPMDFAQFTDNEQLKDLKNQKFIMDKIMGGLAGDLETYKRLSVDAVNATSEQITSIEKNISVMSGLSSAVDEYSKAKENASRIDLNAVRANKDVLMLLDRTIIAYGNYFKNIQEYSATTEQLAEVSKIPFSSALNKEFAEGGFFGGFTRGLEDVDPVLKQHIGLLGDYYTSMANMVVEWDKVKGQITDKDLAKAGLSREDANKMGDELKGWIKTLKSDKKVSLSDFINITDGQNKIEELSALLRNKMADEVNRLTELFKKLQDQIENIPGALGLSSKEWKKLYEEVAQGVSKAVVQFNNLGKSIRDDLTKALYEEKPSSLLDITISNLEKVKSSLDSVSDAYKQQVMEMEVTRSMMKNISAEQQAKYSKDLSDKLEQINATQKLIDKEKERTSLPSASKFSLKDLKDSDNLIKKYELDITSLKLSIQDIGRQLAPSLDSADLANSVERFVQSAKTGNYINAEGATLLTQLTKSQSEALDNQIAQMSLRKNEAEKYTATQRAQTDAQLMAARVQKIDIGIVEKKLELETRRLNINRDIAKEIISQLEFGETAAKYTYQKQNLILESQVKIWDQVFNAANLAGISSEKQVEMYDLIVGRGGDWRSVIDDIVNSYDLLTKQGDGLRKKLETVFTIEEKRRNQELQSLETQKQAAKAIEFVKNQTDAYTKKQQKARDLSIEISNLLSDRTNATKEEVQKWQDSVALQDASKGILVETINLLKEKKKLSPEEAAQMLEQTKNIGKAQKMNNELFGAIFKDKLQKVMPILENMKNRAKDIASAFTSSFSDIPSLLIDRYSNIASANDEIYKKIWDINQLQKDLGRLTADDTEGYASLSLEIQNAGLELARMKEDMKEMSSLKGFLGDIFGNMAKNIASLMAKIQQNEMQTALEGLLTDSGFGKSLVSLFTTASEQSAKEYALVLQKELDDIAHQIPNAMAEEGDILVSNLRKVFSDSAVVISEAITGAVQTAIGVGPSSNLAVPSTAQTSGLSTDSDAYKPFFSPSLQNGRLEVMNTVWDKQFEQMVATLLGIKDKAKDTASSSSNSATFMKSLVTMFGVQLGTAVGTNAFGAKNAAGAGMGSQIGSGLFGSIAKDATKGFLASTIGGAIFPVVGSIAGGLIGGALSSLFNKKEKPPVEQIKQIQELKENVSALRENTAAIVGLSSEFIDLRSELINSPGRFSMPNRMNFGQGVLPGSVGSIPMGDKSMGGLSVVINVNGNMDTNVGQEVAQEISNMYNKQARLNSSNFRMPR